MSNTSNPPTASPRRSLTRLLKEQIRRINREVDRAAWRRFLFALAGLVLSFCLALYATALREEDNFTLAAFLAGLSLIVAAAVAIKVIPDLARRSAFGRLVLKVEYDFTREALVYLLLIVTIVVAALNTGNNLLFVLLACLLAGILVSGVLSQIVLSQVELDFTVPEHLFAGSPAISRLTLHNLKRVLPSFSVTVSSPEPKTLATRRFSRIVRRDQEISFRPLPPILDRPVYVPYIRQRASVAEDVELCFSRRGRYSQQSFRLSTKFPFGLLRKTRVLPARQEVLVLPAIEPTEQFYEILPLVSGEMESTAKGRGHDLYAIRNYLETDSARHVDWKATAKAQQLKVREFTREDERRVVLVFDARLPEQAGGLEARFEAAVKLCACLAWHFYEVGAQGQFITHDFETPMSPMGDVVYPALERLAEISPQPALTGADLLARVSSIERAFNIIFTAQPHGRVPTSLWSSSYIIFMNEL